MSVLGFWTLCLELWTLYSVMKYSCLLVTFPSSCIEVLCWVLSSVSWLWFGFGFISVSLPVYLLCVSAMLTFFVPEFSLLTFCFDSVVFFLNFAFSLIYFTLMIVFSCVSAASCVHSTLCMCISALLLLCRDICCWLQWEHESSGVTLLCLTFDFARTLLPRCITSVKVCFCSCCPSLESALWWKPLDFGVFGNTIITTLLSISKVLVQYT